MRILSKSRENELKEILLATEKKTTVFKEMDIGKATVDILTIKKNEAEEQVKIDGEKIKCNKTDKGTDKEMELLS